MIDGPRTDVSDLTKIWVNQFGQPTRVRNGEGEESTVEYDGTWPALATSSRSPNGHVTRAFYNSTTALMDSTVSYDPFGTSTNAVTKYKWDAAWRAPTSIRNPLGVVDTMAYDGSGNRIWAQTGLNSARRVSFAYTSDNLDSTVTLPSGVSSPVTTIVHNALGNVSSVINPKGYASFNIQDAIGQDTLIQSPFNDSTHASSFHASYYTTARQRFGVAGRLDSVITTGPNVTLPSPYSTSVTTEPLAVSHKYDAEGNPVATRRSFSYNGSGMTLLDSSVFDAGGRLTAP